MPSAEHEVVAEMVARQPRLLMALAALAGADLPTFETMERADSDLSHKSPVELRADEVLMLRAADRTPVMLVILEVQRRRDDDKSFAWPAYATAAHARHRCPVLLIVIVLTAAVERWAARPVHFGGGNSFRPIVIGPSVVPKLTAVTDAEAWEFVVLSALMHAKSREGPEIAAAAMLAARDHASEDDQALYFNLISNKLSRIARAVLKEKLMEKQFNVDSVFSRHWKRVGLKEGRAEGRAEGRVEGFEKGLELGREGMIRSVLMVLDARGLTLSPAGRRKLAAMRDIATLTDTVRRAVIVDTADALFADVQSSPAARKASRRR